MAGSWERVWSKSVSTIPGTVHVVHSNYGAALFGSGLQRPEHKFYVNRFPKEHGE